MFFADSTLYKWAFKNMICDYQVRQDAVRLYICICSADPNLG
uniref:Uncharacterized protein n=1 Tax=Anguilla anguilla TaxID=7936 RepID=A0A0E9VXY6_ANGAN